MVCQRPPSLGDASAIALTTPPLGNHPGELQYLGRPWLRPPPGDLCRQARELRPHALDGDENTGRGVLSQPLVVLRRLISSYICHGQGGGRWGVGMVSRERPEGWISELARFQGPNMVSCNIFSGNQRTPIVGIYLPPSTLDHLPDLEEALNCFPVRYPVVLGYLNADIGRLRNPRDQ